ELQGYLAIVNQFGNVRQAFLSHENAMAEFSMVRPERDTFGVVDDGDFSATELARQMVALPDGQEATIPEAVEYGADMADFIRLGVRQQSEGSPQDIADAFNQYLSTTPTAATDDGDATYLSEMPPSGQISAASIRAAAAWERDDAQRVEGEGQVATLAGPIRDWLSQPNRTDFDELVNILGRLQSESDDPIAQRVYRSSLSDVRRYLGQGNNEERSTRMVEFFNDTSTRHPQVLRDLLLTEPQSDGPSDFHADLGFNPDVAREVAERLVDIQQVTGNTTLVGLPHQVTASLAEHMRLDEGGVATGLDRHGYNSGGNLAVDAEVFQARVQEASQLNQQYANAIAGGAIEELSLSSRLRATLDSDLEVRFTRGTVDQAAESLARMYGVAGDRREETLSAIAARLRRLSDEHGGENQVGRTLNALLGEGEHGEALAQDLIEVLLLRPDQRSERTQGVRPSQPADGWHKIFWYIVPVPEANASLARSGDSVLQSWEENLTRLPRDFLERMADRVRNDQNRAFDGYWWDDEDVAADAYLRELADGQRRYTGE
ncbi:MAG: hypothetical protein AAFQ82_20135, partial [Myxococcota bacterium]